MADGSIGQTAGLVIFFRRESVSGPLCRDCGISLFRKHTSLTLVTGWWGVIAAFVNVVTIIENLAYRRRLGRLGQPAPQVVHPALLPRPLDTGSPLLARPVALIGVAIPAALALLLLVAILKQPERVDGEIVTAGRLPATSLQVGDCFDEPPNLDLIFSVDVVPCAEPHDDEIFHEFELSGGTYPSDHQFALAAYDHCLPAFSDYVGTSYENSKLDISWYVPMSSAWIDGDNNVRCVLVTIDGSQLVGTSRNSGR